MVRSSATRAAGSATLLDGEVSRVAKGADCKSAASWLRRFESFLPHHSSSWFNYIFPPGESTWPGFRGRVRFPFFMEATHAVTALRFLPRFSALPLSHSG